jgi:hypothetical protein
MHLSETVANQVAPTRVTEITDLPLTAADRLAYAFYATAATAALVGQVWAGVTHIPWPEEGFSPFLRIALVTPAVAVIELGGVATAALADLRRRKGEQAYAYRAMSMFAALVALVFNVVGHWRPEERFLAFGFGGLSAFAYVLWLIHSSARRRDALRRAEQMATTGPVYGVVQWAREPKVTWLARSLALEHGYGLYESLRAAREQMRHTARRVAIAGTVAEYIRSEHQDERLAKIAETTYDPDRVAGMLEERINYEVVTNKLTRAISPAPDHREAGPAAEPAGGVVESAGVTTVDPPAFVPPQAPSSTSDSEGRPASVDTSWNAPSSFQASAVVATEFESREERSYLVSEAGVGALGAPSSPTDHRAPGVAEERPVEERFVAAADQERPSISKPEIAAVERSTESSRNATTRRATGTKWDQAVRLLDDWPADTERTGTALAKLIGGSPSYARKLIVRYDQERRPARVLELVKTERSADIRPSTK